MGDSLVRHFAALPAGSGVSNVIDHDSRTTSVPSQEYDAPGRSRRFYLAAWRWHFYAGVFVLPLVFLLAASGLAMLVSEPLDHYLQSDLIDVAPRGNALLPSEQAAAVAAAYPDWDLATFRAAATRDESTRIDVSPKHAHTEHAAHGESQTITVFVDPYTAQLLGELDANRTWYAWAKALHGTLLLGTFGDYVIEIAAGFGVLLIVSGVYLWWPRDGKPLRQALLPAVATAGPRRWRNLHSAIGAWVAPFLLFFFLSGLAWTPFWGGWRKLVQTWSSLPGEQFDAPLSETTHEELNHGAHHEVPWAVSSRRRCRRRARRGIPGIVKTDPITLNDVVGYARVSGFETFRVHWPRDETGVWSVAATTIAGDAPIWTVTGSSISMRRRVTCSARRVLRTIRQWASSWLRASRCTKAIPAA